jgi:signal transduction histidine kinase
MLSTVKTQVLVGEAVNKIQELDDNLEINKIVEDLIVSVCGAEYASIWIYDKKRGNLFRERGDGTARGIPINVKKGLLYRCFLTKKEFVYNHVITHDGYDALIDNPDDIKLKSIMMMPLIDRGELIGIVTASITVDNFTNFNYENFEIFKAISPFIINSIYDMKLIKNNNKDKTLREESFHRRRTDIINNLKNVEKERVNTQTPQEILEFVAKTVHDIKTPSGGLFGFLEILENEIENPRLKEYVASAKESAKTINQLAESILVDILNKREVSKSKTEIASTANFFADIAKIFSSNMYKKNIDYNIFIDPLLPKEFKTQGVKLKRILINLLGNAYKFTSSMNEVEFRIDYIPQRKRMLISVKDTGIGITKENQEHIFEVFKQAEDSIASAYGGTGLGLAISAKYVKELGGKLLVESEIDKGSKFYFEIPITTSDYSPKFLEANVCNGKITILMDVKNMFVINNIISYLVRMGVEQKNIKSVPSVDDIPKETTNLIVFENKLDEELTSYLEQANIKTMVVEENFLSFDIKKLDNKTLISQYSYYADELYWFVNSTNTPRILVIDDEISAPLIKNILKDESCKIDEVHDEVSGLKKMIKALSNQKIYNIVYLGAGTSKTQRDEMLRKYRIAEEEENIGRTYMVYLSEGGADSHAGSCDMSIEKPFDTKEIKDAYTKAISS